MRLFLATNNKNKFTEFEYYFKNSDFIKLEQCSTYSEYSVEEDQDTYLGNAQKKAIELSKHVSDYVISDDSGLEVDHLNNQPGVYSARFAGVNATDTDNNKLLLKLLAGAKNRSAKFVCVIALAKEGQFIKSFRGECFGSIDQFITCSGGFGYDPIFILQNGKKMGELSLSEKMLVSHRKKAIEELVEYLKQYV